MGRIARQAVHVAPGQSDGSIGPVRPPETTVTDGCFGRMARCTQRLHIRCVEVSAAKTPWHDVIDVRRGNPAAGHFAGRPCPQHRRPEATPCGALVEAVTGHGWLPIRADAASRAVPGNWEQKRRRPIGGAPPWSLLDRVSSFYQIEIPAVNRVFPSIQKKLSALLESKIMPCMTVSLRSICRRTCAVASVSRSAGTRWRWDGGRME